MAQYPPPPPPQQPPPLPPSQAPSYRTNNYPPPARSQRSYYQTSHSSHHGHYGGSHDQMSPGYSNQQYRAPPSSSRGNQYSPVHDRRYSGSGPSHYSANNPRNRGGNGGQYSQPHWNSNAGRGRLQAGQQTGIFSHQGSPQGVPSAHAQGSPAGSYDHGPLANEGLDDNPFRPSKDLRVEDEVGKSESTAVESRLGEQQMPPPARPPPKEPQDKAGSKISFTIKSKAVPPPKADFSRKMREAPPRKEVAAVGESPKSRRETGVTAREQTQTSRPERQRDERRPASRPTTVMVVRTRRTLAPEFATSESVYYRKPGNESVVGSGTYGKVFKAIHVYTKEMVALKKIRMEGERDGVGFVLRSPSILRYADEPRSSPSPPSERSNFCSR